MSQHLTYPSRPTLIISASLLLLPWSIQRAHAEQGWACQPGPNGGWACAPKAITATPAASAATTPTPVPALPIPAAPAPKPLTPLPAPMAPAPAPAAVTAAPRSTPATARIATALPNPTNTWDWVPNAAPGACCRPNGACDGVYVEPTRDWEDADKSPKDLPARINAANSELEGDLVKMDGGVTVTQGNTKLTADSADMLRSTSKVNLYGNVVMRQPNMKISGSNADVTTTNSFGHVTDARLLDYKSGSRVTAAKLTRRREQLIVLDDATYTTCPPDREDWVMSADRIRLNRETGRGEARGTVIRVADVPVFYSPYLNFPIDDRRQSGFLWPSIGSSTSGIDAALPYYLNLAPNYDATLTPRQITDRGTMLEVEGRYLNRFSNWVVTGSQLRNDNQEDKDRWFYGVQEQGSLNSYISTLIDYSRVSDNDYMHDFSIDSLNIKRETSLNQQAAVNLHYLNWFASLQVQQYQIIDDLVAEPYRKMPQLILGRGPGGENFRLDYSMYTEVTRFDHADPDSLTDPRLTGDRLYLEPGISFPMRWSSSFINPELRMRYLGYQLERPDALPGEDNPEVAAPLAILDSGLFFDRDLMFRETSYQQTLEPRLYYLYSPYKEQTDQPLFDTSPLTFDYPQLFQPRRLVGHDRIEDFNQLATGVTSRLIENESGRELGRVSVGQIFYFADRRIDASFVESGDDQANSAIAAQVALQPSKGVWAASNVLWDQSNNQIEQGNAYLHYEPSNGGIYNIGYRYHLADPTVSTLANGLRQADASAAIPLHRRWRLLARINYDLDLHSPLEDMVGIEYEDCCWVTRLIYQRAVFGEEFDTIGQPIADREHTVLVEFQLKGLGGLGRKVNTLLEESIWGYRDRY